MATYTDSLGLVKPAAGEGAGTWGTTINSSLTDMLEEAISGYVSIAITGDTTLTTNVTGVTCQARHAIIKLTGSLSSNANIIVPDLAKIWVINNATTGGQTVTVKTANDAGVVISNGKTGIIYCDGADVLEAGTSTAGNATMGGTLGVTGAVTMASTLGVTGNVAVNTDKFTVTAATGNTVVAGTLAVTGVTTATGGLTGSPTVSVSASGNKDATAMTALVGQRIISTASGDTTYTLPDAATADVPVGSTWVIVNAHASADITISSGGADDVIALCSGAAYTPGDASTDRTIVQGGVAEIVCVQANLYVIFGGGVS
jgi:fibronectin-binding autotransporter adhesin